MYLRDTPDADGRAATAADLEQIWRCSLHDFGPFSPLDYYACRDGRMLAVVEIKTRNRPAGSASTVILSVRKWTALTMAAVGLGVAGLYVVRFDDGTRWIDVGAVDGRVMRVGGRRPRPGRPRDLEPVIDVPVADMAVLERRNGPEVAP